MAYNIQVNLTAERDIDEAMSYYEDQQPGLGKEFFIEFLSFAEIIRHHPTRFTAKYPPYRRALMKKFPFAIHFGIHDDSNEIVILAVWHTKRNPDALKERLS